MTVSVVVTVFDSAMQAHGRPAFVPSVGVAMRSFADEVNRADEQNNLYHHPEDFELRYIADFNDENGTFMLPADGMRTISRGKDVIRKAE